ncbi:MAG: polyhydroxyalkanoic acid synthase [Chromatiales bacterium]|jgi:putative polyhydroxyalkanoate system protein|nr:MAG: polyhydroxyalkanoic acid synthase [Chromatiales bacterium]
MSSIQIQREHSLPLKTARALIQKMAAQLKKEFDFECAWKQGVLHLERTGIRGQIAVTKQHVQLDATLGPLLGFLKPRIEQEVAAEFDKQFPAPKARSPATKKAASSAGVAKRRARGQK